jgi:aminopeptidase YwaD
MPNNRFAELDRKVAGLIHTSREPMNNLEVLCDDFGSRFSGTPEERMAADFIADQFRSYGLESVRLESYPYAGWSRGQATLRVVAPFEKEIDCISLPYCPAGRWESEMTDVGMGTPADFERLGASIPSTLVVASSRSPHGFGRWIHRKEKFDRAVLAGADAFIFVSETGGLGPETGSLQNDRAAPIPGISIRYEDGAFLQRMTRRHGRLRLSLETTDINEPRTSWNVVGEIKGNSAPDEIIVLGSHYDGHDIAQGAVDPASGMVVVMEVARVLASAAKGKLDRTLRFVGWGTEEIGLIGSHRYVDAHADELDRIRFYLNLDSAGCPGRKGIVIHEWPELVPFFEEACQETALEAPVGQHISPSSDHFPFFLAGVPSAGMGDPFGAPKGRGYGHTRFDTVDKVNLADLRCASDLAARMTLRVSQSKEFPASRRDGTAVQQIIDSAPTLEGYRVGLEIDRWLAGR